MTLVGFICSDECLDALGRYHGVLLEQRRVLLGDKCMETFVPLFELSQVASMSVCIHVGICSTVPVALERGMCSLYHLRQEF